MKRFEETRMMVGVIPEIWAGRNWFGRALFLLTAPILLLILGICAIDDLGRKSGEGDNL